MFYWLFTDGRTLLSGLLCPLSCLSLLVPVITALWLGVGIQRRASGSPFDAPGIKALARLIAFFVPNLTPIALYTNLLSGMAISRAASKHTLSNGFIAWLVGGPATVNQEKLLLIGLSLCSFLFLLNLALWHGL